MIIKIIFQEKTNIKWIIRKIILLVNRLVINKIITQIKIYKTRINNKQIQQIEYVLFIWNIKI